ncbi:hypothetical protein C4D60_Mb07t17560 [Musa balbisiana]|uniref:Uncharacterized protein n=1 Tax=Musa balbisiana TaxID=52838 RepID=A0A4V6T4F0_MUSBA|nr:hypothetical protein C4D60_Mb07t17560 [Musa balbisiana]
MAFAGLYDLIMTPQLRRQAFSGGMAAATLTTRVTSTTVYSLKLETLRKCCTGAPEASVNREVPSRGITPSWSPSGTPEHTLLRTDRQSTQSPQCARKHDSTMSPTLTSSTCSPTLSTTLNRASTDKSIQHVLRPPPDEPISNGTKRLPDGFMAENFGEAGGILRRREQTKVR